MPLVLNTETAHLLQFYAYDDHSDESYSSQMPSRAPVDSGHYGMLHGGPRPGPSLYPRRAAIGGGSVLRHLGKETICFPNCREAPSHSFGLLEGRS